MLIKARGERLNLIWIFVVTPGVQLWECAEVGSSDTMTSRIFRCNGAKTEICIMKCFRNINFPFLVPIIRTLSILTDFLRIINRKRENLKKNLTTVYTEPIFVCGKIDACFHFLCG